MVEKIIFTTNEMTKNRIIALEDLLVSHSEPIDVFAYKRFLNFYTTYRDSDRTNMSTLKCELIDYTSIALNKVELTQNQREYMDWYLCGYTEAEIKEKYGVSKNVVNKTLIAATKKICTELYRIFGLEVDFEL